MATVDNDAMKIVSFLFLAISLYAAPSLPLTPQRIIEFDTDEGTWISLDVSPDGHMLVFELLGDIYLLPVGGGNARPILTGISMDTQPRFSPDGRSIVFISDRDGSENVWIADADGGHPRQVSREKGFRIRLTGLHPRRRVCD